MPAPSHPILAVAFLCLYAVFTVWTLRRLFQFGSDREEPITYRRGLRFGFVFWAAMTVLFTLRDSGSWNIWARLVVVAFVTLPLSLWAGYFWGQQMGSFFRGGKRR